MASTLRCDTLIKGGVVITMDEQRRVYQGGYIAISDGKIVGVGPESECPYRATSESVTGSQYVVLPGLVNTHAHLVQGCIRGMAEGTTFEERLFGFYYPMTAACDEERSYIAAMPPILELLRSGVTTSVDDHFTNRHKRSVDGVIQAALDAGLRLRMARLIINDASTVPEDCREEVDQGLKEVERLLGAYQGSPTVTIATGPIGITYVREGELRPIWEFTAEHGLQFDIHAPAFMDRKYLSSRGWEGGSFEYLDHLGILGPNLISAHSQVLREGEHDLIASRGATIALVPDMEAFLGLVDFDARRFLERGVACGIGLDGCVVSYHHNLWYSARQLIQTQRLHDRHEQRMRDLPASEEVFGDAELALEVATIGGARALQMDDRIGSLEVGKEADVVVLDTSRALHLCPPAALIADLVYGGGSNAEFVKHVYVAGEKVVADGQPVRVDVAQAIIDANQLQAELLEETGATRFVRKSSRWRWIADSPGGASAR
jgi:5-methylthioadenosine/S-adenosylhomocysteine deaminase